MLFFKCVKCINLIAFFHNALHGQHEQLTCAVDVDPKVKLCYTDVLWPEVSVGTFDIKGLMQEPAAFLCHSVAERGRIGKSKKCSFFGLYDLVLSKMPE